MWKYVIFIISCLLAVMLEGSVTSLPLSVLVIILSYIMLRSNIVFILAFVMGLLLDVMTLRNFGQTSLVLLGLLFLTFLYQRKFEIASLPFVFFSLLIGSYIYAKLLVLNNQFLQAMLIAILGSVIYFVVNFFNISSKISTL